MPKEICHVCKKEKKPYTVFLTDDVFSLIHYEHAREDGPICQRCDQYYAMTGNFKDATKEEFELAKKAAHFARAMHKWWTRKEPMDSETNNNRSWQGSVFLAEWYRKEFGDANVSTSEVKDE
jgi:hypothetical protein